MPRLQITLPDFAIIGANKAGTTSVAAYLAQHPDVGFAYVKEPMFFGSEPRALISSDDTPSWQKPFFAASLLEFSGMFDRCSARARLFGEASTSNMAAPEPSSWLMRKIVPDIKLIAILREPVSRAVSGYRMCIGAKLDHRPFSEIAKAAVQIKAVYKYHAVTEYVRLGLYSQLLKPFLARFPRENILFLKYDDLNSDSTATMNVISEFLGLETFEFRTNQRLNTAKDHLQADVAIDQSDLDLLHEYYRHDILATQELTELDLSNWIHQSPTVGRSANQPTPVASSVPKDEPEAELPK